MNQSKTADMQDLRLEDGDLIARTLRGGDLPCLLAWLSDERVLEFYEGRDTQWPEEAIRQHYFDEPDHDAEFIRLAIEFQGEPVGYGQVYRLYGELFDEYQWPDTGVAVWAMDQFIGVPELWSKGLGTRYVRMAARFLVEQCGASAVLVDPHISNPRAVKCYQNAGFQIAGELPAHELHEGRYEDCYLMVYQPGLTR